MASERLRVRYRAEARDDIKNIRDSYESLSKGLGASFRLAVRECLDLVRNHPELFELVDEDIRRALLTKFPYAVFYESKRSEIIVYGVVHTSRDEAAWRERFN